MPTKILMRMGEPKLTKRNVILRKTTPAPSTLIGRVSRNSLKTNMLSRLANSASCGSCGGK